MSMNWNIRFPKDQLAQAAIKGKMSFAIGYHGGAHCGGRAEVLTWLSENDVYRLWTMLHEMTHGGKTPQEALAVAEAGIVKHREKAALREANKLAETEIA